MIKKRNCLQRLLWGYIHVYYHSSGINLNSQVSVYRAIGPLIFSGFSCFRPPTDWSISHELK